MDLHRHAGHPAGHLRDVRGGRRASASAASLAGHDHAHRRARRDGRRAAARGDDGRRRVRSASRSTRRGSQRRHRARLPRQRRPASTRRCGSRSRRATPGARSRSACSATPPTSSRELLAHGCADRRRHRPDLRARPARATCRAGVAFEDWRELAERDPDGLHRRARASRWPATSRRWSASRTRAPRCSTTATRSAPRRELGGYGRAFDFPGFVPAYIRPLFCEGAGPFRWVALSGDPGRHRRHRPRRCSSCSRTTSARALDPDGAARRSSSRAFPRASAGSATASATSPACASTSWSPSGELKAPVVIGRDHLDCGSVASPYRETEGMLDGSRRDRRLAAAQRAGQLASGATWVSIHHGGGVGIGRSIHAGQVTVADGTRARRGRSSSAC